MMYENLTECESNSDAVKNRRERIREKMFMDDIRPYIKPLLLYVIFFAIMCLTILNKNNLHVDEISSYILSNHQDGTRIKFEEGYTYTSPEQVWLEGMTVNDGSERFDFKNVWENQTKDVHPPLYYLFLHIICSINIGNFSVWYAAAINICFAMLTLHVLRKLLFLFMKDTVLVDMGSIVFILSAGVLQNVSFFRMYVMAMFWVTVTEYLLVKGFEEKFSWKLWGQICLSALAGALTHYYCIIYLCAISLVLGICLIIEKRWKDIAVLASSTMTAGMASIIIFPAMIRHMFSGYRGKQSIDNLTQGTWSVYWERLKSYYGFINTQMLGKVGGIGIVFIILVTIVLIKNTSVFLQKDQDGIHKSSTKKTLMKWIVAIIPIVIYFVFVSESAAYVTDRYLFPIYTIALAMFLCIMADFLRTLMKVEHVHMVMCFVGTVLIVNGFANANWTYLYKSSADLLDKSKTYSDRNCISVYDENWKEQPSFYEIRNYKSITYISQENVENILQYEDLFEGEFMLKVIGGNDEKIIHMILEQYPSLDNWEKVGSYGYATTYRIFAED